ncbi:MAG TPA: hypothetical protein VMJ10_07065 [Kofleriaceae bacterium]|nr:hypothetical protein [Kofleriaceae bacterium]
MKALAVVVLLVACYDDIPDLYPLDQISKMSEIKDKMCACTDRTCARRESLEYVDLTTAGYGPLYSDEDTAKLHDLVGQFFECGSRAARVP